MADMVNPDPDLNVWHQFEIAREGERQIGIRAGTCVRPLTFDSLADTDAAVRRLLRLRGRIKHGPLMN